MGNEISCKRYCCGKPRMLEKPTAQENTAADLPVAQTAQGDALWSSVNHPLEEKWQDTATGMGNKDEGRENGTALSSLPVAQIMRRTTELEELGETQPSADQTEKSENKATSVGSPDGQTCASTRERPATAQQAEGDTGVRTDFPLQAATETGAEDVEVVVTDLATAESGSVIRRRPSSKLCKPSPLCKWLKQLRSPAGKAKVKPEAITSQEGGFLEKDN